MVLGKTLKDWTTRRLKKLGFSRSKSSDLKKSYYMFQTAAENKILQALNITLILCNLMFVILFAIAEKVEVVSIVIMGISIVAFFTKRISIKLWKILIALSSASFVNYIYNSSKVESMVGQISGDFIIGNSIGMAEYLIILSLKNTYAKVFVILCYCILKVIFFYSAFNLGIGLIFGMFVLFCVVFCIYYDHIERQNFKEFYKSKEEARKFQNLVNHDFPTSVLILDDNLNFVYSNDFFKKKLGSTEIDIPVLLEKFKIRTVQESRKIGTRDDYDINLYEYLEKFLTDNNITEDREGNILLATLHDVEENKTYHYEIRLRKISWGLKSAYAVVFNDTSDKQIVLSLKYADQQKNRVINTLSHELKTPINGILGLVRIIKARVQDQVSQTYLDYCEDCSNLLLNFINSLLDYNQIKKGGIQIRRTSFSLNALLKELKSLYTFHAELKDLKFTVERDTDLSDTIYTDKDRLTMVLVTLLGNAFKFTTKGSVSLRVNYDDERNLVFKVSDTGPGIREENKNKLFNIMGNTPEPEINSDSHGIGLGLTTMNEFVTLLNGGDENEGLKIDGDVIDGSSFYFRIKGLKSTRKQDLDTEEECSDISLKNLELREIHSSNELVTKKIESVRSYRETYHFMANQSPLETKEETSFTQPNQVIKEPKHLSHHKPFPKNILVVDDNPFNILAVSFILEKFHCQITKAFNGEECLQTLEDSVQQNQQKFDLILMDIQMPVLDGVEASRIIKEKIEEGALYQVPVVALTANRVDNDERERYKQNGILKCLEKPLKEAELCKSLDDLGFKIFQD